MLITPNNMDFVDVKKLRKILNLTQKELADKIGVSVNTIQNYEKGGVIPASRQQQLLALEELTIANVDVESIKIDEQGSIEAVDKIGVSYKGKAIPNPGQKEESVYMSREVFNQISRLTETVLSQQRTIEMLVSDNKKDIAGAV